MRTRREQPKIWEQHKKCRSAKKQQNRQRHLRSNAAYYKNLSSWYEKGSDNYNIHCTQKCPMISDGLPRTTDPKAWAKQSFVLKHCRKALWLPQRNAKRHLRQKRENRNSRPHYGFPHVKSQISATWTAPGKQKTQRLLRLWNLLHTMQRSV